MSPEELMLNWLKSEGNTTGDNGDAHHNWGSLLTDSLQARRQAPMADAD